ncbi:MAG: radical SAM protein [Flavobacterium sp.]|uniref:radical SAM protein n=1 Tax=Flavobacterium sp. TaxID=239 RepID=UPI003BB9C724
MKYSKYNSILQLSDLLSVLYNSKEDKSIIISNSKTDLLKFSPEYLANQDSEIYNNLIQINAIVADDKNELQEVIELGKQIENNDEYYKLIINPTMGCNFSCWYCYESHIVGSKMSKSNVDKIIKFIDNILLEKPNLKTFDLAFFGGEPLMYYSKVTRPIIDYYRTKYEIHKNINFEISFTSNGYLLSDIILNHLIEKNDYKHFQITLDGNREEHNQVRVAQKEEGSYDVIIESIRRLLENGVEVVLRVNYTALTAYSVGDILNDISHFTDANKRNLSIDFHRVWQDKEEVADIDEFINSIKESFENSNFRVVRNDIVENFKKPCYADRENEVVINFNGDIYKCTARDFSKENSYGFIDDNGKLNWNDKIETWKKLKIQSKACQSCRILPLCGGGCHQINLELLGTDSCQMGYSEEKKDEIILTRLENLFFHE